MSDLGKGLKRRASHANLDRVFWVFFVLAAVFVGASFIGYFYPELIIGLILIAIGFYKVGELAHIDEDGWEKEKIRASVHRMADIVGGMQGSVRHAKETLEEQKRENVYRLQAIKRKMDYDSETIDRRIKLARASSKRLDKDMRGLEKEMEDAKGLIEQSHGEYQRLSRKIKEAEGLMAELRKLVGTKQEGIENQVEKNYRDLARKIIEIENRLNRLAKAG